MNQLKTKGFTFIELIIAVSIMAILVFTFSNFYANSFEQTRDHQRKNDLVQYKVALEAYANQNELIYPIFINSASASLDLCPVLSPQYLSKCLEDVKKPDDASQIYKYQSSDNGLNWVLWTKLEAEEKIWVMCSNGKSGSLSSSGFIVNAGDCPL